ncbi:MAG: hypothetical protein ACPGQF_12255, partial [Akkermansiaceae bacterium]
MVVVYVYLDPKSERLVASQRISRHFSTDTPDYSDGSEVDMIIFGKTDMGYKAIVDGKYSGLLFKNQVFEELFYADEIKGYVTQVRNDRKVDLSLYAPGNIKIENLETRLERELNSRGGFWAIDDKSSPEIINLELGVSKKVFKKATGALFKKRKIAFEDGGIRWIGERRLRLYPETIPLHDLGKIMSKLAALPSVEKLASSLAPEVSLPRPLVNLFVRREIDRFRQLLLADENHTREEIEKATQQGLIKFANSRLQSVINATGVLIHTNLGRSPLGPRAATALEKIATGYSNLEFDLSSGTRGKRAEYLETALACLLETEAATAVN